MLLIYGLGNNDPKYLHTKHNAGRIAMEKWANLENLEFQKKDKYAWSKGLLGNESAYFVYSLGYMNESGQALQSFLKYFKLEFRESDNLVILQDDSDQLSGKQKFVNAGGSAGHHGINDIYRNMQNWNLTLEQIRRIKIGIRPEGNKGRSEHFVLQPLGSDDLSRFEQIGAKCYDLKASFTDRNWPKIQQELNSL